jgi:phosphinothricin acetyltransferase
MSGSEKGKDAASKPPRFEGVIRVASEADMAAAQDIYAHYVSTSRATFEETPPTLEEMLVRRKKSIEAGLPYLIAEVRGETVGFAYAAPYHARPAYRFTVEDSVYVAKGFIGLGVGSALLGELTARCVGGPWRQMVAIVGDSANAASIARQRRFGFVLVGVLKTVGFKFNGWVDTPMVAEPTLAEKRVQGRHRRTPNTRGSAWRLL